jgi:hypothetical protein
MKHVFDKIGSYLKFELGGGVEQFTIPHIGAMQTYALDEKFEKGGAVNSLDMKALHELIKAFVEAAPKELNLDEKMLLENSRIWEAGGAVSFNALILKADKNKLKVGENNPNNAYLVLSSDINKSGVGDGKSPAIARTYVVQIEIKGEERYTQRRTERDARVFAAYQYSRTIEGVIEKFKEESYPKLKKYAEAHGVKFEGVYKLNH